MNLINIEFRQKYIDITQYGDKERHEIEVFELVFIYDKEEIVQGTYKSYNEIPQYLKEFIIAFEIANKLSD
jgi:hypothetical protein